MTAERFRELTIRYQQNLLNVEETRELYRAWISGNYDVQLEADIRYRWESSIKHRNWTEVLKAKTWGRIQETVKKDAPAKIRKQIQQEPARFRSWFFAAAMAILVAGITYLAMPVKPKKAIVVANIPGAPGSDKAFLTLSDGRQIILDSTTSGKLAEQDGIHIIKLDNSVLSYKGQVTGKVSYNTLTTPRGGQFQLELPDGSHVWLNSASALTYPTAFTGEKREVELNGEGFFEIAHDAGKPFKVKVRNMNINVLGTGFNVMAYTDENAIRTTLVHGSVRVEAAGHMRTIAPGQQISLPIGKTEFEVSKADLEQVLAWKDGGFLFRNASIQTIMRQISRWYDITVEYNGAVPDRKLSGSMPRKENVIQLLDAFKETGIVDFSLEGNKIIVTPGNEK